MEIKLFFDYKSDVSNWITLTDGEVRQRNKSR
jgi:hypothetical protein